MAARINESASNHLVPARINECGRNGFSLIRARTRLELDQYPGADRGLPMTHVWEPNAAQRSAIRRCRGEVVCTRRAPLMQANWLGAPLFPPGGVIPPRPVQYGMSECRYTPSSHHVMCSLGI